MMFKNCTTRSPKYLDFVRKQRCVECGSDYLIHAHHTAAGGVSLKGDDLSCIPLCHSCHRWLHDHHSKAGWWSPEELTGIISSLHAAYQKSGGRLCG